MTAIRSVLVCEAQVPFVRGGAERMVDSLIGELRRHGYRADKIAVPFKSYPKDELLTQATLWRLLNIEPVDLVITTKFPTYCVRHPNKITWLMHQHRAIYDLCGTPFTDFRHVEGDVNLRSRLIELDNQMLAESTRLYTISRNVAARLERYNGLKAEALYHPPALADRLQPGPLGNYVLSVGRLELNKRVDLIIRALAQTDPSVRLIVSGRGPHQLALEILASDLGVADRVQFTGEVDDQQLIELYANALAVVFPPYDEDYGYVTLEAFFARKPVITTTDAGGPLEFVDEGVTGLVADPTAESVAAAIARLADDRALAKRLGDAGFERARTVTWKGVVERLVDQLR